MTEGERRENLELLEATDSVYDMRERLNFMKPSDITGRELSDEIRDLRELVADMCEWAYVDSHCDLQQEFADRMRKLGIEVETI